MKKFSAVGIDPFLIQEKEFDPECLPAVGSIDLVHVFFGFINKLILIDPVQRRTEEKKNEN